MDQTTARKLNDFRELIMAEFARRMGDDFSPNEIAEWLINEKREATVEGLEALIVDALDRWNDQCSTHQMLKRNPNLSESVSLMRTVSETLGVGVWYLLTLPNDKAIEACKAAELAFRLRAAEDFARADALEAECELMEPVWKDHPEMNSGEARAELKRQTDETLRRLDGNGGYPTSV
jgi:hypothetical protein